MHKVLTNKRTLGASSAPPEGPTRRSTNSRSRARLPLNEQCTTSRAAHSAYPSRASQGTSTAEEAEPCYTTLARNAWEGSVLLVQVNFSSVATRCTMSRACQQPTAATVRTRRSHLARRAPTAATARHQVGSPSAFSSTRRRFTWPPPALPTPL